MMKHDKIYKNELEPKRECTIRDVMRAQNKFGFQYCVSTTSLINKACTNIKEKEKRKKSLNLQRGLWTGRYLNNTELSPNETKKEGKETTT